MHRRFRPALIVLAIAVACMIARDRAMAAPELPANWFVAGANPENINVFLDDRTMHIIGVAPSTSEFGSVMQTISPEHYVGRSVRFTADVKSWDVVGWVGLWMRVDGRNREILSFDNMQTRPITGTTAWKTYSIVLPVDTSASDIAFGILLSGRGEAWMKNLSFRVEAPNVPSTAILSLPNEPNLDLIPAKTP